MNLEIFLSENFGLSATFFALLGIWVWIEYNGRGRSTNPQEVVTLINDNTALAVDIRTADLFHQGHIPNSICLAEQKGLKDWVVKKITKKDKQSKSLILICANGQESRKEIAEFKKLKIEDVSILGGGIARWSEEGFPLKQS